MPVRNGLAYLTSAVDSVLSQTYGDFEFLIIDDHSQDDVLSVLAPYARADKRIKILKNSNVPGISAALNTGLRHARGEYIARQDSDDLSLPMRFEEQVKFLDRNPAISIVGSFTHMISSSGEKLQRHREPIGSALVLFHSQVGTPFAHPTVMWRNKCFRQAGLYYREVAAQDFDLWMRAFEAGARGDNIAEDLVHYRVHPQSDSNLHHLDLLVSADMISRSQILRLTGQPAGEEFCTSHFRGLVHAILTGSPIQALDKNRADFALAAELLRRGRVNKSFELSDQRLIENLIAARYQDDRSSLESPHSSRDSGARCEVTPALQAARSAIGRSENGPEIELIEIDPSLCKVYASEARWCSSIPQQLQSQDASRREMTGSKLRSEIPVYVACFNNPTHVRMMVDQLIGLGFLNIILVDGGSTFPPMLSYFQGLPDYITLVRLTENRGPRFLFQERDSYSLLPNYFCLTDPDLEFNSDLPSDFLSNLIQATEKYEVGKAGFSLYIADQERMVQDLFDFGTEKLKIWEWEAQFWKTPLSRTSGGDQIYRAQIDTTFALYNKNYFDPANHLNAVRIADRFTCRHLPWYADKRLSIEEEDFYRETARFSFFAGGVQPATSGPDVFATALTPSNDGWARLTGPNGIGLFVVAATNRGASRDFVVRIRQFELPLVAAICETDSATSHCKAPPTESVNRTFVKNENTTWAVFLKATGTIAKDAALNRLRVEFVDTEGNVCCAAAISVTTDN
jgi:hypothetical protein